MLRLGGGASGRRGRRVAVAVKVRHPGVAARIAEDFRLLRPLAALTSRIRSLKVGGHALVCRLTASVLTYNSYCRGGELHALVGMDSGN